MDEIRVRSLGFQCLRNFYREHECCDIITLGLNFVSLAERRLWRGSSSRCRERPRPMASEGRLVVAVTLFGGFVSGTSAGVGTSLREGLFGGATSIQGQWLELPHRAILGPMRFHCPALGVLRYLAGTDWRRLVQSPTTNSPQDPRGTSMNRIRIAYGQKRPPELKPRRRPARKTLGCLVLIQYLLCPLCLRSSEMSKYLESASRGPR